VTRLTRPVDVVRVQAGGRVETTDRAAAEEPLSIRLHGQAFATIMRTPGRDRELTAGFLLAERLIRGSDDLALLEHCADAGNDNVVNVRLADDRMVVRALESRREVTSTSSCGVCGRQTIETLTADMPSVQSSLSMSWEAVAALPSRLRAA